MKHWACVLCNWTNASPVELDQFWRFQTRTFQLGQNRRLRDFFTISSTWLFHLRLLDRVRPNTLAFGTTSMSLPLITVGSNEAVLVEKLMRSSLHFGSLSSNLFTVARVEKVSTAFWMLLFWPLLTVSETVVSSTDFHRSDPGTNI